MNKNIINLVIAILFSITTSFGSNIISIPNDGGKAFIVDAKTWKSESLSVKIRDDKGQLIFEDDFSLNNGKKFNLEKLPNGSYSILLSNKMKSVKQYFTINSNEIVIEDKKETTFSPVINISDDHLDLNYFTNEDKTSVSIYNSTDLIYSVNFKNQNTIHQRFDISNLPKGSYTMSVTSGNNSHYKKFQN